MSKQDNKDKLRVYEYAKNLNMSSKEIITILKRLNIPVNNHMSVMENEAVTAVEGFFRDIKAGAAAKRNEFAGSANRAPVTASASEERKQNTLNTTSNNTKPSTQPTATTQAATQQPASREESAPVRRQEGGRPQGGNQGGYDSRNNQNRQNNRPNGGQGNQGGHGHQGGQRQGGQSQGGNQSGRPQGQGNSNRPQGQGGQGGQGGNNNRPPFNRNNNNSNNNNSARPTDRKPFDANRSQTNNGPRPTERPITPVTTVGEDMDDLTISKGKPVDKKAKQPAGNKRFDDNKPGFNRNSSGQSGRSPFNNNRGGKGKNGRFQEPQKKEKIDNTPKKVIVRGAMTVGEIAKLLHKDASEVIKKLLSMGIMATINQELDVESVQLIIGEFNIEIELKLPVEEDPFEMEAVVEDEANLEERPPVVTIMGHVDHGKTTLLDAIRHTNVTEGEAGGITQHIGAYQVEANGRKVTFLDTPGHAAFTTMRARGAQVTDIAIIVVAADDGVMPQTVEAISHAKAAKVPIIIAVNKIDKPDANPDRIKQELTEYELVPEEWGGDTIFVNISAKQRIGLENLLEMILLVAEVQELKANPNTTARGTVIEAELDKGRGPVARVLVQQGTFSIGDVFVAGNCLGRVRAMVNDKGKRLKEAGPSTPIEVTGLTEVPQAGDLFIVFEDERKAREIADKRSIVAKQAALGANSRVTLDDLHKFISEGEMKDLFVIIKGDVQGSVEALKGSLEKIDVEGVRVKIIHTGVGAITESDIILASASNAIIIGFNVRPEPAAKQTAEQEKVDIRLHSIIYKVMEEIESAMKGLLDPVYKENIIGHAEVRNTFKVTKVGTIAGCMVIDGKMARNAEARLIRDGIVIFTGKLDSLKRFKDDAKEVAQGYECGITLEKYNDVREGDIIEAFVMETVER